MHGGDAHGASVRPHDILQKIHNLNRFKNVINATRAISVVHFNVLSALRLFHESHFYTLKNDQNHYFF